MNFNNQELNSFLSVPGDHLEQPFPSLSPQRSGSPRSILSEQIQQQNQQSSSTTSNLGSFRTRARAGTLPSRLYSTPSSVAGTNQSYSPSFNSNAIGLDPNSINFDSLSISNTSPPSQLDPINSQVPANAPRTRLRSGSLLGLSESNSIWGDSSNQHSILSSQPLSSSISNLAPTNDFTKGRISPTKIGLQSQTIEENLNSRVRAYSTNNALVHETSNQNFYLHNLEENIPYNFGSTQPITQQHDHLNGLSQFQEQNRPRAQTYQNGSQTQLSFSYNNQGSISELPETTHQNLYPPKSHLSTEHPLLLDNIDSRLLNWTSTFQDSSLGPTSTLFFSNLPAQSVSPLSLANLLIKFGKILTVRIFIGNDSALVEFENLESAMQAKAQLNHQELMPGFTCIVTFAKILPLQQDHSPPSQASYHQDSQHQQVLNLPPPKIQINSSEEQNSFEVSEVVKTINDTPPQLPEIVDDIYEAITKLGVDIKAGSVGNIISNALKYKGYDNDFGPLPDPIPIREFDAPKLRETRKAIDTEQMSQFEIEELSIAILDELPELSSDYLGNTVVQKLFQYSSTSIKYIMLKEVAPYLAQMGIHKNGTWSAQKMISVADTPLQKAIVAKSLKPYCVPLFNDQFGNYVIQCSLKFGSPWNDFIFEVILAKFWLIVQNRFGARAVRACLESHEASVEQTAIISAAIILHAEHLAINQNAALLITWFLDTCTLSNRHILIAPRLIPHLAQLCTHKLASLTVLKILNNRYEVDAKNLILNALFGQVPENEDELNEINPPEVLEQILQDNVHGATFVFKVLSNPQLESNVRKHISSQVRKVLLQWNTGSYQGYKRLLDEVGLSNRLEGNRHSRSHSNSGNGSQRNKGRQSKTSPNQNSRRSTPNGSNYRQQQLPVMQQNIPLQPQFIQNNPNEYPQNDLQHQYYQQHEPQQQFQNNSGNYGHEVPFEFDNNYMKLLDDRLNYAPQYHHSQQPFNNSLPVTSSINFSHQPQFGYGAQF